jgi:hypothetical protein
VSHQHHCPPLIGQPIQVIHHLFFQPRVETRSRFVQEEEIRLSQ